MKFLKTKLAAAVALVIAASGVAFALNPSLNYLFNTRQATTQQTNYYRVTVNYNDPNIASGVKFGRLPANAFITSLKAYLPTAFNASTTNVLTVGTSTTATEIIASTDINEASANTMQNLTSAAGLGLTATSAGEVDLYAKYTQTGTAATAGQAVIVIEYIPNNDL